MSNTNDVSTRILSRWLARQQTQELLGALAGWHHKTILLHGGQTLTVDFYASDGPMSGGACVVRIFSAEERMARLAGPAEAALDLVILALGVSHRDWNKIIRSKGDWCLTVLREVKRKSVPH